MVRMRRRGREKVVDVGDGGCGGEIWSEVVSVGIDVVGGVGEDCVVRTEVWTKVWTEVAGDGGDGVWREVVGIGGA
jgi:hypothetical protein